MSSAVDTLSIYERLKDAELSEPAAKEIAEVIKDVTESHLTTKDDLRLTETRLREEIKKTKVELIKWVAGMLVAQAAIVATLVKLL